MLTAAAELPDIDISVQREGLGRRAKRLVVLDVDSTLIQDEVIELLAAEAGCRDEVRAMTEAAMAGELDFEESLRARVRLLAGLEVDAVDRAWANLRFTPGAEIDQDPSGHRACEDPRQVEHSHARQWPSPGHGPRP